MLESKYQKRVIDRLNLEFPGCVVVKNDSEYKPGFPDLTVFYGDTWAILEVKARSDSPYRPNQEWYLDYLSQMSYAATIYPENEEEIFDGLHEAFGSVGEARYPKSQ